MKQNVLLLAIAIFGLLPTAYSQTFFYLNSVTISPNDPSPDDEIMVTIDGLKSTPCAFQEYTDIYLNGNQANIDMCWNDTSICIQVLDPWTETYSLGNLASGNYTLNLGGCNHDAIGSTYSFSVSGNAAPVAQFELSSSSGCTPLTIEFVNLSLNADTYLWNFGGLGTSTETNPSFTFEVAGSFDVSLEATNAQTGETALFAIPGGITVYESPTISLGNNQTIQEGGNPLPLSPGMGFAEYLWSDGSTDATLLFEPNEYGLGMHTISVEVTDENGCQAQTSILITVEEDPNGIYGPTPARSSFQISPNPAQQQILLTGWPTPFIPQMIRVYQASGHLACTPPLVFQQEGLFVNVQEWAAGVYLIVLSDNEGHSYVARFLKL